MKKLLLILAVMLFSTSLYAMDEKYETDIVFDKNITMSTWTSTYTFVPTNKVCYASTTDAGYSWQGYSDPFILDCDSISVVAEIDKGSLSYTYVDIAAGLYSQSPGYHNLPHDTTGYNYIPKVLLGAYEYGQVVIGLGTTVVDNATYVRQMSMLRSKLWIRIGYRYGTGQTIHLRIYITKYRKGV